MRARTHASVRRSSIRALSPLPPTDASQIEFRARNVFCFALLVMQQLRRNLRLVQRLATWVARRPPRDYERKKREGGTRPSF